MIQLSSKKIRIPNNWVPRDYQQKLWSFLENGGKRAIAIWHRRAGKDDLCLHWTATAAMQKVGSYWHMLPEAAQAKKAIWQSVNPHTGKRRIDEAFPPEIRKKTNDHEMFIEFINGSTWQLVGSDNYNSLVGASTAGIVFSEWALANPLAWSYLRPILAENNGWALFITTPRGDNHARRMVYSHKTDENWFVEILTAEDTKIFSPEKLAEELREYQSEYGDQSGKAKFDQEYLCSFDAAVIGAYWGAAINLAEKDERIASFPWLSQYPVTTAWDLGYGDATAIWFVQKVGGMIRVIDFYQANQVGMDHYAKVLKEKPYTYDEHIWPHDGGSGEFGTGLTREATARTLGIKTRILPRTDVADGINAVSMILPLCQFDAEKCKVGIEALRLYRSEWNEKTKTLSQRPVHDWTSHPADAFRYLAVGIRMNTKPKKAATKQELAWVI